MRERGEPVGAVLASERDLQKSQKRVIDEMRNQKLKKIFSSRFSFCANARARQEIRRKRNAGRKSPGVHRARARGIASAFAI